MRAKRVPVLDEYAEDGEAAVFVDGRVVVLSPLATHLFSLIAEEWTDLATLSRELELVFGVPPDRSAAEATADALRALEAERLVLLEESVKPSLAE